MQRNETRVKIVKRSEAKVKWSHITGLQTLCCMKWMNTSLFRKTISENPSVHYMYSSGTSNASLNACNALICSIILCHCHSLLLFILQEKSARFVDTMIILYGSYALCTLWYTLNVLCSIVEKNVCRIVTFWKAFLSFFHNIILVIRSKQKAFEFRTNLWSALHCTVRIL